ncbi:MAG TPA: hypothetical protein DCM10_20930 [Xanthomarina gelatinilytica]|nr:hypothetical protein [Xanthomarina gelatinilytica]
MELKNIFVAALFFLVLLTSCTSSMTPSQVNNTLPTLTESMYYNQTQASAATKNNTCKILVKGRTYAAPIGFTVKNDLKNAAKGIDEWVELDGGNAYVFVNYKWLTVNDDGATQLYIDFNTRRCE